MILYSELVFTAKCTVDYSVTEFALMFHGEKELQVNGIPVYYKNCFALKISHTTRKIHNMNNTRDYSEGREMNLYLNDFKLIQND